MKKPSAAIADTTPVISSTVAQLPLLLTRRELADVLRCRPDHVSDLIHAGELVAVQRRLRKGSPILVPRDSLRNYLQRYAR